MAGYLLWPYVAFLTYANCLNYFHLKENGVSVLDGCQLDLAWTSLERHTLRNTAFGPGVEPPSEHTCFMAQYCAWRD